jgi:hypothetical protein
MLRSRIGEVKNSPTSRRRIVTSAERDRSDSARGRRRVES